MVNGRSMTAGLLFLVLVSFCAASDPNVCSRSPLADPCLPEATIQKWMVWQFWQSLQPGMDKDRILETLGEPLEKESTDTACVWYYQEKPQQLASGMIQRPRFGLLTYKKSMVGGQEVMVLKNWKEPNWNEVKAYTALQYHNEQQKIDQLKQAEAQRLEELEKKRQAEEERKRQQEIIRQQQLEQERRLRAEQAARDREFSLTDIPQVYWFGLGGALVGLAIAIVFIKKPFSG